MKKIVTSDEKEKKDRKNKIIIGVILIALMILSTAGGIYSFYASGNDEKTRMKYKGQEFTLAENGYWNGNINGVFSLTKFNPKETENISVPINFDFSVFSGKTFYFSYDSDREHVQELLNNIPGVVRAQEVCLENAECAGGWAIKNCNETDVFIIRDSEETLFKKQGRCVYIEASREELGRATDAFIFRMLGL